MIDCLLRIYPIVAYLTRFVTRSNTYGLPGTSTIHGERIASDHQSCVTQSFQPGLFPLAERWLAPQSMVSIPMAAQMASGT
jgi:hypothetical protein